MRKKGGGITGKESRGEGFQRRFVKNPTREEPPGEGGLRSRIDVETHRGRVKGNGKSLTNSIDLINLGGQTVGDIWKGAKKSWMQAKRDRQKKVPSEDTELDRGSNSGGRGFRCKFAWMEGGVHNRSKKRGRSNGISEVRDKEATTPPSNG